MPTLRELLDKQKNGASTNAKPILQPKAEQKVETVSPSPNSAERGTSGQTNEVGVSSGNEAGNSMVEQGPPAGLSGLALIRWRKENAGKNVSAVSTGLDQKNSIQEAEPVSSLQVPAIPQPVQIVSPSQGADASKSNDGVVPLEQLKKNLIYLANNIEQKELVGQIVRTIAIQLKNNPSLAPQMANSDVDLVVRGLRSSFNIAARKKAEARDAKTAKTKQSDDVMAMFKDAGLGDLKLNLK